MKRLIAATAALFFLATAAVFTQENPDADSEEDSDPFLSLGKFFRLKFSYPYQNKWYAFDCQTDISLTYI